MTGLVLNLLGLVLALGVPVLIAMRAPQRWRMIGFLAWLFLPLILGAVMAIVQAVQKPQSPDDLGKLLFGLAIIGSVLAIPWALACGVGFAIGSVLRPKTVDPVQSVEPPIDESVSRPEAEPRPPPPYAAPAPVHRVEEIDPYLSRHSAPDGSILVELSAVEWSNSHWVESPRVIESATGRILLDLWGTDWDAVVRFPASRMVALSFRRYRGGGELDAEIHLDGADFDGGYYVIRERSGSTSQGALADMPAALEAAYRRSVAAAAGPSAPQPRRGQFRVGLLILVGALSAIAGATFVVTRFTPQPVQHLDKIPPMPNSFCAQSRFGQYL